ncbi:acetyl-CoA synthetase-like protein [Aspergillus ellipticus CBS 707.79]|uniref:Acetyl-CoA synthetase-like protein n=1 Tax=Aspergillus ellipticus CBS 707.79 TaxID=1448320 RepID=A0A319DK54_9EURO|nr:acetyl-CoA synthetase-like protein [Aspergillus ellipticus CBS 707.79]
MTYNHFLSLVEGSTDTSLWSVTLGKIVQEQAAKFGDNPAAIFPWQDVRLSFDQLSQRGRLVANALLQAGIRPSDPVGIMAGNRYEFLEVTIGAALIGCPVLVLNNTYKPWELRNALQRTACRCLFIAATVGSRSLVEHLELLKSSSENTDQLNLDQIVILGSFKPKSTAIPPAREYNAFLFLAGDCDQQQPFENVNPSDVLSLQFTSGTTGEPKASMLTHINLLNNARFLGERLELTPEDIVCCAPPLFHCFGLVMGFFSTLIHGATIVFPSDHFNVDLTLGSIVQEKCTTLLGVPTMFAAELQANDIKKYPMTTLRKGMTAGSPVPLALMEKLRAQMGIQGMVIAYGMTETSTITFCTSLHDAPDNRAGNVGQVMPHVRAKIVNLRGRTLGRGERGELCISGYALQKGYLNNKVKTSEVMKTDEEGTVWMHTGDECIVDTSGCCHVTGRIKDIIIRGGENIFPAEIENHLLAHPSIAEASVVGVHDVRYGEVVGCFLKGVSGVRRPSTDEVRDWVKTQMGTVKTPQWVFWVGPDGVCLDFPKTGSGKYQKHVLRNIANKYCAALIDAAV